MARVLYLAVAAMLSIMFAFVGPPTDPESVAVFGMGVLAIAAYLLLATVKR